MPEKEEDVKVNSSLSKNPSTVVTPVVATAESSSKDNVIIATASIKTSRDISVAGLEVSCAKVDTASAKKSTDSRFQKTRSFSAVEDNPEKKGPATKSSGLKEFPFKDVAHSRSEQLEVQQKDAKASVGDQSSENIPASHLNDGLEGKSKVFRASGDTFGKDYDFGEQPMSLQYDTTSVKIPNELQTSKNSQRSGRDLTELNIEIIRERKGRFSHANARPRLELTTYISIFRNFRLS